MTNRFLSLFAGGVLTLGLGVGVLAHDGKHPERATAGGDAITTSIEGELIDSACYVAADGDAKGAGHAACARKCLGSGVPAAILPSGNKDPKSALFLLANSVPLAPHAGKTIKVKGTPAPDFKAFDVQKLYVKEGSEWKEVALADEHHKMSGGSATKPAAGHHH